MSHVAGSSHRGTRRGAPPGTHRLRVDPIACAAHGVCAEMLPELIGKDPWGYPIVSDQPIPPALLKLARRTAASCPTLALLVEPLDVRRR